MCSFSWERELDRVEEMDEECGLEWIAGFAWLICGVQLLKYIRRHFVCANKCYCIEKII